MHQLRYPFFWALAFAAAVLLAFTAGVQAQVSWPQVVTAPEGEIIVYQPQPERLEGNQLSGRAAFQLDLNDEEVPIFGALWFTARIETDRDADLATVFDFEVTDVAWPDSKDVQEQRFTAVIEGAIPTAGFDISLSQLTASLETAEVVQASLEDLNNDPPEIVFEQELAVLVLFDGKPKLSEIENSPYERVLNVPVAIACKKRGNECWLSSGKFWYAAKDPLGPWTPINDPPQDLAANMPEGTDTSDQPDSPPAIVVATEPTELIVTQGAPAWTSLPGGEILYVANTESPWLRYLPTGDMYVLLSGRWYRSKVEAGPWTFVKADELPAAFAEIPPASDIGGLRTSVAGTPEAGDAVREQAIPQTAAIDRKSAMLTVEYDGKPKFEKIEGTDVSYAVNTGAQVLEIGGRFYAVDNGVWFTSASAEGPWVVADEVPEDQIAQIPPSSPVYNTTHVHVYESTPDVVYVGYTPGYLWSYPYYGVPVYGTGWYYPPYYGRWYYPRPPTWGFNVGYNPWTGWNFGLSWSNGFFSFGMSWGGGYGGAYRPWGCCGGWYGGGYRGPTIINTGDINIGNSVNVGNRTNIGNRISNDQRFANMDRSRNLYNRPEVANRKADRATVQRDLQKARPAVDRPNNVFADQSGQVARPSGDKWQTREDGQWKDAADRVPPETRDQARDRVENVSPEARDQVADRAANASPEARDRAAQAAQNRPESRPASRPTQQPAPRPPARPTSRPSSGSLNTRDLNRSASARQRGAANSRAKSASRGGARRR
jgi:hypothetical protein